jgi:ribonucleoside-diphosphate reductase alpha chain
VNLWLPTADMKTMSHMYRHAWRAGLKTTYYLRCLGASGIEKASVNNKKEVRGIAGGGTAPATPPPAEKKVYTAAEKTACSIEAMRNGVDCEACQ